eukprot:3786988-Prorocentrum_lima.AAC.1
MWLREDSPRHCRTPPLDHHCDLMCPSRVQLLRRHAPVAPPCGQVRPVFHCADGCCMRSPIRCPDH